MKRRYYINLQRAHISTNMNLIRYAFVNEVSFTFLRQTERHITAFNILIPNTETNLRSMK